MIVAQFHVPTIVFYLADRPRTTSCAPKLIRFPKCELSRQSNRRQSAYHEDWVLTNAGARPADRDSVDTRVIKSVREQTVSTPTSQKDVGG